MKISDSLIEKWIDRARRQEARFGHNTGHFSLPYEKENTITGTIGEGLVVEYFKKYLAPKSDEYKIDLASYGAPFDIEIENKLNRKIYRIHVKTGLWKNWPSENFDFGIHADQYQYLVSYPLILVSLLKSDHEFPRIGRIEGFLTPQQITTFPIIRKGEVFPHTGVVSRTDNILTQFSHYQNCEELIKWMS